MEIGTDLDDVLADFTLSLIKYHNIAYGTSLTREQFRFLRYWEIWGGTAEQAIQKVSNFYATSKFRDIQPVAGSLGAVNILQRDNNLSVITSRPLDISETTREWINRYFPNAFSGIHFAANYYTKKGTVSKSQMCDQLGIEVMIEDSLDYALGCLGPDRQIILLDCPWNQSSELPSGVRRVYSWPEIVDIIQSLNQKNKTATPTATIAAQM